METKLYEVLKRASLFLEKNGAEPRVAEILLQHHLGLSRNDFFMKMRETVDEEKLAHFHNDVENHAQTGVPVQHLIGMEEFYGRMLKVNRDVLIPRPETEEVVAEAIRIAKTMNNDFFRIVDVGTGSGIIGITLALELPGAEVMAIDLSEKALHVARENAAELGADVRFMHGSFLEPLIEAGEKVDLIVSNPPYIPYNEKPNLSRTVTEYDPEMALFAENDGLAAYEAIVQQSSAVLNPEGGIVFEIGHDQGETVPTIIRNKFPEAHIQTLKDINGKDRIVTMQKKD
ncbi:peptide chain release factor N(5)-glutamine methyltransferase [Aciduricibacillus chroicocephali]|uniref:Release factor glutamine methyltransferase n=1 Tax=Aciduricibacillus chroicocephali TaxID=3054939 RepID=A0ABY9KTJ4_9BACI|nr:peptide chain release factor N(5)-glutamine methyltransferase [Bacillaceae bacterium 44XB]